MKIGITAITVLCTCILIFTGTIIYTYACKQLQEHAKKILSHICEEKKDLIKNYFNNITTEIITFARNPSTTSAMKEFKTAFKQTALITNNIHPDLQKISLYLYYQDQFIRKINNHLKNKKTVEYFFPTSAITIFLQTIYIAQNPNPPNKKFNLVSAPQAGNYNLIHKKYHPIFNAALQKFKYYDIFLIDNKDGTIYYTVVKEIDFAKNLFTGELQNSNLARLAKNIMQSDEPQIIDFQSYYPSYAAPAAFIAAPIKENNNHIGTLSFQIPINQINAIVTDNELWKGLGKTGETFLVGSDFKMRSITRPLIKNKFAYLRTLQKYGTEQLTIESIRDFETTILLQTIKTPPVQAALENKTGIMKTINYEHIPVLSAYTLLEVQGLKWAVITEQSLAEICAPARRILVNIIFVLLATLLICILIFTLYRKYKKPNPST